MPKFRKKPVVVEAVQLRPENWDEMCQHADVGYLKDGKPERSVTPAGMIALRIPTPEGLMTAVENDWVIKGVAGELCPCMPHIFEQTYEKVNDEL